VAGLRRQSGERKALTWPQVSGIASVGRFETRATTLKILAPCAIIQAIPHARRGSAVRAPHPTCFSAHRFQNTMMPLASRPVPSRGIATYEDLVTLDRSENGLWQWRTAGAQTRQACGSPPDPGPIMSAWSKRNGRTWQSGAGSA
jgi:hypothetical protein